MTQPTDTAVLSATDWTLINEDARAWASQYAGQLVQGITRTSATILQGALSDYIGGTLAYRDLLALLAPTFGSTRATTISQTEITRAFSEGNRQSWQRTGVIEWWSWQTASDERVCPICDGLDGEVFPMDAPMPPGHVKCRCWTSPEPDGPSETQ
jgi:SPP1 gp7 family putative phage head morphogenesis protein